MNNLRARKFDAPGITVAEIGEEQLLHELIVRASESASKTPQGATRIIVGPGDDAAVWQLPNESSAPKVILSSDAIVEGEDFLRHWSTPYQVGQKAVAVAVSDLAAMGVKPELVLATVCMAADTIVDDFRALALGLNEKASATGARVVGGDLSKTKGPLVIDVTVVGSSTVAEFMRRDQGAVNDLVVVTGSLGRAAAGLKLLQQGINAPDADGWITSQLIPTPRIAEGLVLQKFGIKCAGDLSDGLIVDAERLVKASSCGMDLWVDTLPVQSELQVRFPHEWLQLAISGGEDFELLFTVAPNRFNLLIEEWPSGLTPLTVVGKLVEGNEIRLLDHQGGTVVDIPAVKSRHF